MLRKRFAALVSILMVLMFCASLLAAPVAGAAAPASIRYAEDGDPVAAPGGLEITGYYIQSNNVVPDKITKGMGIGLSLTITDRREEAAGLDIPNVDVAARLNTASFRAMSNNAVHVGQQPLRTKEDISITYDIYFELIYTGEGSTFQADLYYMDKAGNPRDVPVYPLSLSLNQCEPYEPGEAPQVKGTGFVLRSASYGGGKVEAGKPFTLSAELLATNGGTNVENVTVGITPPEQISLSEGSSINYIGTVAPNQAVPVSFSLFPGANVEDGSYTVAIDIKGVSASDGSEVAASINFTIPVIQPERFEIFESQLPGFLTMGMDDGSGYGSITLVNQGKGTVSNVSVEVKGTGLTNEEGKQYLGHIAGGEQKTADFLLMAMEPGEIDARVVVSYESTDGKKKTLEQDFTVLVEDGGMIGDPDIIDPMPDEPEGGFPVWGWVLIVVAILVAAGIVLVVLLRRRKARRAALEQADLAENEDDDDFDDYGGDDTVNEVEALDKNEDVDAGEDEGEGEKDAD